MQSKLSQKTVSLSSTDWELFKEGNVCLEIRDNATGIDEVMDRVFEPFVSTKRKG